MKLVEGLLRGDRISLARSITLVENEDPRGQEILHGVVSRVGSAHRVGVTGPPGCGKSTLVRALTQLLTDRKKTVGIVAVDPSSPFTGGALLGDRIRMTAVALHPGVFIRSMASRGAFGGLAVTSQSVADLLDAFGRDYVLYETVGVGQSEVEITHAADTAVVVLSPESGDGIQAMKAGLMEIADIIVVNKADREGVDRTVIELQMILKMRPVGEGEWDIPILKTSASNDQGVEELLGAIETHREYLSRTGLLNQRRQDKMRRRICSAAEHIFRIRVLGGVDEKSWEGYIEDVLAGRNTPTGVASELVDRALGEGPRAERRGGE
jgi:LAO/AO transport system kinase